MNAREELMRLQDREQWREGAAFWRDAACTWMFDHADDILVLLDVAQHTTISSSQALPDLEQALAPLLRERRLHDPFAAQRRAERVLQSKQATSDEYDLAQDVLALLGRDLMEGRTR